MYCIGFRNIITQINTFSPLYSIFAFYIQVWTTPILNHKSLANQYHHRQLLNIKFSQISFKKYMHFIFRCQQHQSRQLKKSFYTNKWTCMCHTNQLRPQQHTSILLNKPSQIHAASKPSPTKTIFEQTSTNTQKKYVQ